MSSRDASAGIGHVVAGEDSEEEGVDVEEAEAAAAAAVASRVSQQRALQEHRDALAGGLIAGMVAGEDDEDDEEDEDEDGDEEEEEDDDELEAGREAARAAARKPRRGDGGTPSRKRVRGSGAGATAGTRGAKEARAADDHDTDRTRTSSSGATQQDAVVGREAEATGTRSAGRVVPSLPIFAQLRKRNRKLQASVSRLLDAKLSRPQHSLARADELLTSTMGTIQSVSVDIRVGNDNVQKLLATSAATLKSTPLDRLQ